MVTNVEKNQLVQIGKDLVVEGPHIEQVVEVLISSLQDPLMSCSIISLYFQGQQVQSNLEYYPNYAIIIIIAITI